MDKIEFLSRYHDLKVKIQKKKDYIAFCDERSLSIPGPSYGEKIGTNPSPSKDAPFVFWIYKKIEAEEKLKEMEEQIFVVKKEIEEAISSVNNETYEKLLTYRYIDWLSWREIWELLYISKATLYRWRDDAIDKLQIKKYETL